MKIRSYCMKKKQDEEEEYYAGVYFVLTVYSVLNRR